jgi:hypothetical protein
MPRGMKKGLNTAKFDRCVSKVKSPSGKKANPYAVCNATMGGKSKEEVRVQERDNKTSLSLYVKLMVIFDKIS